MASQFLYDTRGYRSGDWSSVATNLYVANTSSSFNQLSSVNGNAFYRTSGGAWRRFYSTMNNGGYGGDHTYGDPPNSRGTAQFLFKTNGELSIYDTDGFSIGEHIWDAPRAPDAADLQIKAEIVDNFQATWTGTMNTWQAFTVDRQWFLRTGIGVGGYGLLGIDIRHGPTSIQLDSFLLSATVLHNGEEITPP
jgi:hypothetical protein